MTRGRPWSSPSPSRGWRENSVAAALRPSTGTSRRTQQPPSLTPPCVGLLAYARARRPVGTEARVLRELGSTRADDRCWTGRVVDRSARWPPLLPAGQEPAAVRGTVCVVLLADSAGENLVSRCTGRKRHAARRGAPGVSSVRRDRAHDRASGVIGRTVDVATDARAVLYNGRPPPGNSPATV
jgi:hypothetical protein